MHGILPAHAHQRLRWWISLAAAIALLQPALVSFDVDLSGWRPDHGHLSGAMVGTVTAHEHPYDQHHQHNSSEAAAGDPIEAEADVVFVSSDSATSTAIPAVAALALTPRGSPSNGLAMMGSDAPLSFVTEPPAPPPRI